VDGEPADVKDPRNDRRVQDTYELHTGDRFSSVVVLRSAAARQREANNRGTENACGDEGGGAGLGCEHLFPIDSRDAVIRIHLGSTFAALAYALLIGAGIEGTRFKRCEPSRQGDTGGRTIDSAEILCPLIQWGRT
jgi:hypothetical protein